MTTLSEAGYYYQEVVMGVRDGFISARSHPDDDKLVVFNYTPKTQYEQAWSDITKLCRGLVLKFDQDKNDPTIMARPFPKFFNLGELESAPQGHFIAQEKMDGSLGIVYRAPDGEPAVATRGSFASDQAIWATEYLRADTQRFGEAESHLAANETLLVEIIYPANRIVVNYGDMKELVALTAISNATGLDVPVNWGGRLAEFYVGMSLREIEEIAAMPIENREGFVLLYQDGTRVKIKLEEYVALHAKVTGLSTLTVWSELSTAGSMDGLLDMGFPDELHEWIQQTSGRYLEEKNRFLENLQAEFDNIPKELTRKEFAAQAIASPNSAGLFRLLDGKPVDDLAWNVVRPIHERPCIVKLD